MRKIGIGLILVGVVALSLILWWAASRPVEDKDVVFHSFTVTPATAEWNQTVTLTWNVTGAATLRFLAWDIPPLHGDYTPDAMPNTQLPVGSFRFTIPNHSLSTYTFYLVATSQDGKITDSPAVEVSVRCPYKSLTQTLPFSAAWACPYTDPTTVPGTYQPFEHARMIWYSADNTILVLEDNAWYGASISRNQVGPSTSTGHPPAGLYAPGDVFGKVWDSNPKELGWALQPQQSYSQNSQAGVTGYIDPPVEYWTLSLPDGSYVVTDYQHWENISK